MDSVTMDFSCGRRERTNTYILDERKPIVYTTKLDDMRIFKSDLLTMSTDTIVKSIINESKPKLDLNRKRKIDENKQSRLNFQQIFYRQLLYRLSIYNILAMTRGRNNNLLAMCKPVRVVLQDIKHLIPVRKPVQLSCRVIYDLQNEESNMYFLDQDFFVVEHTRLPTDKKTEIHSKLKYAENMTKIYCCCWYARENYIESLVNHPRQTLRYLKIPHQCVINYCQCCCKKNKSYSDETLEKGPAIVGIDKQVNNSLFWFDSVTHRYGLHTEQQIEEHSRVPKNKTIYLNYLESRNLTINEECYVIGTNGQINLFLKDNGKNLCTLFPSSTANKNIVENICCWYKREQLSNFLLDHMALPETVNFIRRSHQCSIQSCTCCCKPINKIKLKLLIAPIATRHTNDMASENLNINFKFPVNSSTIPEPSVDSFNVSFIENRMAEDKRTPEDVKVNNPELVKNILERFSNIQFTIQSATRTHQGKVYAKVNINALSITELKLLDHSFCVIKELIAKKEKQNKSGNNNINKIIRGDVNNEPATAPKQKSRNRKKNAKEKQSIPSKASFGPTSFKSITELNMTTQSKIPINALPSSIIVTKPTKPKNNKKSHCSPTHMINFDTALWSNLKYAAELKSKSYVASFREYVQKLNIPEFQNAEQ